MAKEEPTKDVVKRLLEAGFERKKPKGGSHVVYKFGSQMVSICEGHKYTSPGVQRKVDNAIAAVT